MVDMYLQTTTRMIYITRIWVFLRFDVVSLREMNADGQEHTRLYTCTTQHAQQ